MTRHPSVNILDTEATFEIFFDLAFKLGNFRINEDAEAAIGFVLDIVSDNYDTVGLIYLDSGQGNANLVLSLS